ncbi:DUF4870 domain-containing protein [Pseudomonas matsuisoli]|uniref:Orotate phosphoribosyltransferase n=1 Tax=Pseudomonas matsuisoli TaxID=1515666 RepID=A0A917PWM6_9PSED|nr:DUF4870 domain-containing protein [Pseudomonas matsuisoli]GGJ95683.1 orotate phosphoribosyltransferase [Pseudomonas matsuisoli]
MNEPEVFTSPGPGARRWAMLCHFSAFFGLVFPFGHLIGPLVLWQLKKDDDPFIDAHGKEALNFQITVSLWILVCLVLYLILIGIPLLVLVSVVGFALAVVGGIKANQGRAYRYPFTWRPVK